MCFLMNFVLNASCVHIEWCGIGRPFVCVCILNGDHCTWSVSSESIYCRMVSGVVASFSCVCVRVCIHLDA